MSLRLNNSRWHGIASNLFGTRHMDQRADQQPETGITVASKYASGMPSEK